jgi:hypothetical protein
VRNCLGVLAGVMALCMMLSAQAPPSTPAPTPPSTPAPTSPSTSAPPSAAPASSQPLPSAPTPQEPSSRPAPAKRATAPKFSRIEWFAGYSYAQTGFFNAGHWAGLNGWNASFALNAASWIGVVVEGGQYFGTSRIPTAVPAPFPPCKPFCPTTSPTFNVDTKEYSVLFGLQFPYRKHENWTPFGEVMFGHAGVRGEAIAQGLDEREVSSGLPILIGGGIDHKINQRFALRIKADYLGTRFFKQKQDNLTLSIGLVIRSVPKKKRRLEDETQTEP